MLLKLARYLSKYISKDLDSQPREFEEHRYFCSLGIAVPTERVVEHEEEKFRFRFSRIAGQHNLKMFWWHGDP